MYRIVAPRDFNNYELLCKYLDNIMIDADIKIITGGRKGIDRLVERYCIERGYTLFFYIDEWLKYGRRAKMIVNREMVFNCDIVIAILTETYSYLVDMTLGYASNMKKLIYQV